MISHKMQQALNEQINKELYSAYLYKAMSAVCSQENLDGFANWFNIQAQEEYAHAMGFYNHIIDRGGVVNLLAIDAPFLKERKPLDLFKRALEHEQYVTACIYELSDLARSENDKPVKLLLDWYIREQLEEESTAEKIIDTLSRFGNNENALFFIDKDFSTRTFVSPTIA